MAAVGVIPRSRRLTKAAAPARSAVASALFGPVSPAPAAPSAMRRCSSVSAVMAWSITATAAWTSSPLPADSAAAWWCAPAGAAPACAPVTGATKKSTVAAVADRSMHGSRRIV